MEHVQVIATVIRPDKTQETVNVGSYPVWALPLTLDWKMSRRQLALDSVGHYPQRGDGWRVTFTTGEVI